MLGNDEVVAQPTWLKYIYYMNISIDESLVEKVMHCTQAASDHEAVEIALREYLRQQRKQHLLALRGKLDIEDNWQSLREMEIPE